MITKGAIEEILKCCKNVKYKEQIIELDEKLIKQIEVNANNLSNVGMQVIALAEKKEYPGAENFNSESETEMTFVGYVAFLDPPKKGVKETIIKLKKAGVNHLVMLTGDAQRVAEQVASDLGITKVYSELLPAQKVEKVEELLTSKAEKDKLAFVGDGINDAPVLSRADIGIAMGALGSDAAIEAADIVLMDDDPLKIVKAIRISKKCMRIVYENIYFAIGIKILCLILGALGIANMWLAIFADVGVMVIAVLNAIRVLFVKKL